MSDQTTAENHVAPDPVKAGVIGYPIGHSLSPLIHGHWIDLYGLNGRYEPIQIDPKDFDQTILRIKSDRLYDGFNVTLPYKEAIMDYCDDIHKTAQKIGAVNTVSIKNGKMKGRNTDAFGFLANLKNFIPDFDFANAPALVLGAGGAARAIVYALCDKGTKTIYIANRTAEKAEHLASDFSDMGADIHVLSWDDRQTKNAEIGLVVNTTSLGMTGKNNLVFDVSDLSPGAGVYDIVYAPLYTDLLTQARNRNLRCVTGLGMLLHQARPAFEAWFGVLPDVENDLINKITKAAC